MFIVHIKSPYGGVDSVLTKCYYHFETDVTIKMKLSHY